MVLGKAIPQSGRRKKACENAMGPGEGQNIQIFDWESWCPKLQEWGQAIHWAAANGRLEMVFGHPKGCWDQETDHLGGLESEYHLRIFGIWYAQKISQKRCTPWTLTTHEPWTWSKRVSNFLRWIFFFHAVSSMQVSSLILGSFAPWSRCLWIVVGRPRGTP